MSSEAASRQLHARVVRFIRESVPARGTSESFDQLACDIARFQAKYSPSSRRVTGPQTLERASDIPAIPTDVFKLARVACHEASDDIVVFRTSGTTIGARGEHALRTTETYALAALSWAGVMLMPGVEKCACLMLAPPVCQSPESSLGFMLGLFSTRWSSHTDWVVLDGELQAGAAISAIERAGALGEPMLVAGASFAFVHLLDALGARRLPLIAGSRVMQTGGFKGKSRSVDAGELRAEIASLFEIDDSLVVSEYGMTELGSQAYEGSLRAALNLDSPVASKGVYMAPPWMRVIAVDPITFEPVAIGEPGIAKIIDLTNVDSAVAVQTSDVVQQTGDGFVLYGRATGATERGCSIGVDELLSRG